MHVDVQRPRVVIARQYASFAEFSGPGLTEQTVTYVVQNNTTSTYMCILGRNALLNRPIRPRRVHEHPSGPIYVQRLGGAPLVAPTDQARLKAVVTLEQVVWPVVEEIRFEDFTELPASTSMSTLRDYKLHIACFKQEPDGFNMTSTDLPVFLRVEYPGGCSPQQFTLRVRTDNSDFAVAV